MVYLIYDVIYTQKLSFQIVVWSKEREHSGFEGSTKSVGKMLEGVLVDRQIGQSNTWHPTTILTPGGPLLADGLHESGKSQ